VSHITKKLKHEHALPLICKSYIKKQKTHTKAVFEQCILAKEEWMVQYNKKSYETHHHLQNAIMVTMRSDVITYT